MRRLVALYPRAWRDRYATEFLELLAERPATIEARIDVLRGAVDAWIHPQVVAPAVAPADGPPLGQRVATAAATVAGGAMLIGGGIVLDASPILPSVGYKESTAGVLLVVGGLLLVGLAALGLSTAVGSRRASSAAMAMLSGCLLAVLPWPILVVGFYTVIVASIIFASAMWKAGQRVAGAMILITSLLMTSFNTEDERALLTIPFAVAWMLVGVAGIRARAPAGELRDRPAT